MDQKAGDFPMGWGGSGDETIRVDDQIFHGGRRSARIERNSKSANGFSTLTMGLPMDFTGRTLTLQGFVRTEDVSQYVGLWMRQDGNGSSVAFDNMQGRVPRDTTEWKEYSIVLPLQPEARQLVFGFLAATPEHERVAALETKDAFARTGKCDQPIGDVGLIGRRFAAAFAGKDKARLRPGEPQHARIDQRVVHDHVGLCHAGERIERQLAGIARSGAGEPDVPRRQHRHAVTLRRQCVPSGHAALMW